VWVTSIPEPPVSSGYLYTAWSLMRAPAKSYEITEAAPRLGAAPKSRWKKRFRGHARADAPGVKGRCIRRRRSSVTPSIRDDVGGDCHELGHRDADLGGGGRMDHRTVADLAITRGKVRFSKGAGGKGRCPMRARRVAWPGKATPFLFCSQHCDHGQ
jgi:hypothetical protein